MTCSIYTHRLNHSEVSKLEHINLIITNVVHITLGLGILELINFVVNSC